jgi:hypothetical protein
MKRTFLSVAAALSLLVPITLARPADVSAAGDCGVEQVDAASPLLVVLPDAGGETHLYSFRLTAPCADKITVSASYDTRTKVAKENLTPNVDGGPSATGEWTCPEDPWLYSTKTPSCKRTSQAINGVTGADLGGPAGGGAIISTVNPMTILSVSDAARQTLRDLVGAGASAARTGEEPDLAIEVVGLKEGSKRDVVIRVTNVSDWWSDTTKATVELAEATNGSRPRTYDIPDLNTAAEAPLPHVYEFVYTLPGDCYMAVVKASLTAGTNYAGVKEINLDNNVAQAELCPAGGGTNVLAGPQTGPSPVPAPKPASKPATGS